LIHEILICEKLIGLEKLPRIFWSSRL